jgi:hypothetical protein
VHELDMKDVQYVGFRGLFEMFSDDWFGKDIMNMISTPRRKE